MEYLLIFISAIFVNNIVLSQFLGICPFLGVSQKVSTSLGMGAAVAFVLTLATIVTYLVQIYLLDPFGLQYLQTITFILVIAALVQMVEIILKKFLLLFIRRWVSSCLLSPLTVLCWVWLFLLSRKTFVDTERCLCIFYGVGFALALVVFAGIREQLSMVNIPKGMRGMAIVLVTAGL